MQYDGFSNQAELWIADLRAEKPEAEDAFARMMNYHHGSRKCGRGRNSLLTASLKKNALPTIPILKRCAR
jgi:hypothetical protein